MGQIKDGFYEKLRNITFVGLTQRVVFCCRRNVVNIKLRILKYLRFEALIAVTLKNILFWYVNPSSLL